jgi:hypothetical protein
VFVAGVGIGVVMLGVRRRGRQFAGDPDAVALPVDALGKADVALDAVGAERRQLVFDAQGGQRVG